MFVCHSVVHHGSFLRREDEAHHLRKGCSDRQGHKWMSKLRSEWRRPALRKWRTRRRSVRPSRRTPSTNMEENMELLKAQNTELQVCFISSVGSGGGLVVRKRDIRLEGYWSKATDWQTYLDRRMDKMLSLFLQGPDLKTANAKAGSQRRRRKNRKEEKEQQEKKEKLEQEKREKWQFSI